jgi:fucose permease
MHGSTMIPENDYDSNRAKGKFVRTQFTWLAYALLGYFGCLQTSVGPLMAFLRTELHLSYTIEGLHFSAWAFGAILAGINGDYAIRLLGRRSVLWGGGGGMAVGAMALIMARQPLWTLLSIVLMGYAGNLLLISMQAALSDTHGKQRSIALLEGNVMASIGAFLAPFGIGLLQEAGAGWRSALVLVVCTFLLLFVFTRRIPIPAVNAAESTKASIAKRLPIAFWAYWIVVIVGMAIEWCITYWSADFLVKEGGLSKANAAGSLSLFFVAAVVGRFLGSRLARRIRPSRLVVFSIAVAAAGFLLFWLAPILSLRLSGLLLAGLGIANLYPLAISLTLATVPQQADSASARISLGSGLSVIVVPFVLGAFADRVGLRSAFSIVAMLLLIMIIMVNFANRLNKQVVA